MNFIQHWQALLWLLLSLRISAQVDDSLAWHQASIRKERTGAYFNKPTNLFVFTDRSIYTPSERVWFSAYEFYVSHADTAIHPLFLLIVDRARTQILWSGRFAQQSNFAAGSFSIPDSIADGDYALVAYTDKYIGGNTRSIFYKNIYIRSARIPSFSILPFENSPPTYGDTLKQRYLVSSSQPRRLDGVKVAYRLYADSALVADGVTYTNRLGEIMVKERTKAEWNGKNVDLAISVVQDSVVRSAIFPVKLKRLETADITLSVDRDLAGNTLLIGLQNLQPSRTYFLAAWKDTAIQYFGQFQPNRTDGKIKLCLDSIDPANITFCIYNEAHKKLAEQTVFIKTNQLVVSATPDSTTYHTRSKVRIKVTSSSVPDNTGKMVLSVSCAASRRMRDTILNNIERFYYCSNDDRLNSAVTDTTRSFGGTVVYRSFPVTKRIDLLLLGGQKNISFSTDSLGRFNLQPIHLLSETEQPIVLSVTGNEPEGFVLQVREPDRRMNEVLRKKYFPSQMIYSEPVDNEEAITQQERSRWNNTLQAAVVTHGEKADYIGVDHYVIDPCDADVWICSCGHLNCDGCPPKKRPDKGSFYMDGMGRKHRYAGCPEANEAPYIKKIDPLLISSPFTSQDPAKQIDANLHATLFWDPRIEIPAIGQTVIEFYTGDLPGRYTFSIEGVSAIGPVHQRVDFYVR